MENSKIARQEKAIPKAVGQQQRDPALPPILADFLKGKAGQTGCKRRNFRKKPQA